LYTEKEIKMKEEQILKAARKLISKYGFKKVSMDEIAQEANVTKKTVYAYFDSKESLLNALIRSELSKVRKDLEEIESKKGDLISSLHEALYKLMLYRHQNNFFKILFEEAEIVNNSKLRESIKIIEKDIIDYIKTKLEETNKQGLTEIDNIEVMSFLIYKMYIALIIEWNDSYKELNEKDIADNILKLLKKGIIKQE
jgi:AcrR family transcriptional regulator